MRYLLQTEQVDELHARQVFLYDIFCLYFIPGISARGFIPLNPVGQCSIDVLFITGHADAVEEYLTGMIQSIPEKAIVITSCMGSNFKKFASNKEIYVPSIDCSLCKLRDGRPYGFDFAISDCELDLYNSSGTIKERIQSAYRRL